MRVYGDRARSAASSTAQNALAEQTAAARALPGGLARHSRLVELLIEAAALHQGIADLELERAGLDEDTDAQGRGLEVLRSLARAVAASWDDPARPLALDVDPALTRWREATPDALLSLRVAEGFAHYAVYPEAYLEAARAERWASAPAVIGLRSIGAALAPMAAAASDVDAPIIMPRPIGDPFARRLALGERLRKRLRDHVGPYVVVDEGPGLSGSSFGAVGDVLKAMGASAERVIYIPSHDGEPGPMAHARHRERWNGARRLVADFDSWIGVHRLATWAADALGAPVVGLTDLSGGAWRASRMPGAPALPMLERRKFLAQTRNGPWLLKFAGLGREGRAKAERARVLAAAGFSPAVGGLAHGFLATEWVADARFFAPATWDRTRLLDHLASYLAFRAGCFPAGSEDGADLWSLAEMARINAAEALGEAVGQAVEARLRGLLAGSPTSRSVHVDGRLHAWEWLMTPTGRLLKTDAVDHSCGHDLVGCQDIGWDVAGAEIELGLSPEETERLARILGVPPSLLAIHRACYPAFQLGLWSFAPKAEAQLVHIDRYREALCRFVGQTSGETPWMEARRQAT